MGTINQKGLLVKALILILFLPFTLSCATSRIQKKPQEYVFFPPPPDISRIQFLTSISKETDFARPKSSFADFILGKKKKETKKIKKPYGVSIHKGTIYVCDTFTNHIDVLNLKKRTFSYLGDKGTLKFKKPINIIIDKDGRKYITDSVLGVVAVLDKANNPVATFGKGQMKKPTGIALFENRIYITDVIANQVVVMEKNTGEILDRIGGKTDERVKFEAPTNIAVDTEGNIYVSETMGFRIRKLTPDGKPLLKYGAGIGDGHGQFARPKGLAVDREGRIYSIDAWHSVVQIFNAKAEMLLFFGELGNKPGNLNLPAQIIIDYDNVELFRKFAAPDFEVEYLIIVTSQFGLKMINIFGFGHKKGEGDV